MATLEKMGLEEYKAQLNTANTLQQKAPIVSFYLKTFILTNAVTFLKAERSSGKDVTEMTKNVHTWFQDLENLKAALGFQLQNQQLSKRQFFEFTNYLFSNCNAQYKNNVVSAELADELSTVILLCDAYSVFNSPNPDLDNLKHSAKMIHFNVTRTLQIKQAIPSQNTTQTQNNVTPGQKMYNPPTNTPSPQTNGGNIHKATPEGPSSNQAGKASSNQDPFAQFQMAESIQVPRASIDQNKSHTNYAPTYSMLGANQAPVQNIQMGFQQEPPQRFLNQYQDQNHQQHQMPQQGASNRLRQNTMPVHMQPFQHLSDFQAVESVIVNRDSFNKRRTISDARPPSATNVNLTFPGATQNAYQQFSQNQPTQGIDSRYQNHSTQPQGMNVETPTPFPEFQATEPIPFSQKPIEQGNTAVDNYMIHNNQQEAETPGGENIMMQNQPQTKNEPFSGFQQAESVFVPKNSFEQRTSVPQRGESFAVENQNVLNQERYPQNIHDQYQEQQETKISRIPSQHDNFYPNMPQQFEDTAPNFVNHQNYPQNIYNQHQEEQGARFPQVQAENKGFIPDVRVEESVYFPADTLDKKSSVKYQSQRQSFGFNNTPGQPDQFAQMPQNNNEPQYQPQEIQNGSNQGQSGPFSGFQAAESVFIPQDNFNQKMNIENQSAQEPTAMGHDTPMGYQQIIPQGFQNQAQSPSNQFMNFANQNQIVPQFGDHNDNLFPGFQAVESVIITKDRLDQVKSQALKNRSIIVQGQSNMLGHAGSNIMDSNQPWALNTTPEGPHESSQGPETHYLNQNQGGENQMGLPDFNKLGDQRFDQPSLNNQGNLFDPDAFNQQQSTGKQNVPLNSFDNVSFPNNQGGYPVISSDQAQNMGIGNTTPQGNWPFPQSGGDINTSPINPGFGTPDKQENVDTQQNKRELRPKPSLPISIPYDKQQQLKEQCMMAISELDYRNVKEAIDNIKKALEMIEQLNPSI